VERWCRDYIRKLGIVIWRKVVHDRDGWRRATRKALILLGFWSHRRRIKIKLVLSTP
jgi:hypothetical protein